MFLVNAHHSYKMRVLTIGGAEFIGQGLVAHREARPEALAHRVAELVGR